MEREAQPKKHPDQAEAVEAAIEQPAEGHANFSDHGQKPPVAKQPDAAPAMSASDQAFEGGFGEYIKVGTVQAEQLAEPLDWTTGSGDKMHADAGDWKITGSDGGTWSVKPDIFAKTYSAVAGQPGHYAKTAVTHARKLAAATTIKTLEGEGNGAAGDYLVKGPNGEEYIVTRAKFESMYRAKAV